MSLNRARAEQPTSEVAASAMLVGRAHLGAGALLAQGVVLRSRRGSVRLSNHSAVLENIPDGTVLIGRPPHVLRTATDADRVRPAGVRGGQVNLTHHPGTAVPPMLHHRTPR